MFDPKYKMRHRPEPIARLLRYKRLPPPMVGDPKACFRNWSDRCWTVYATMMEEKHKRDALWMWSWSDAPERSHDAADDRDDGADQSVVDLSAYGTI